MYKGNFNGTRLREARHFNKKTIGEIAEMLGVTKQMVSKYENGKASPSVKAIFVLAKELGFPQDFYFTKNKYPIKSRGTFFRSYLTTTQAEKRPAGPMKDYVAVIRDYLNNYLDFPKLDWDIVGKHFSPEDYAIYVRKKWDLGDKPIVDMVNLLETHGFIISKVDFNSNRIDAFSSSVEVGKNKYYLVFLEGSNYSFYRQQFSLAHELGHWLLHNGKHPQQDKDLHKEMENEANQFASAFLMPDNAFRETLATEANDINYYVSLKRFWNVSIGSMIMRARVLGIISFDEYVSLQRKISYRRWRKEEPLDDIKAATNPVALKQAIELLVENNVIKGYDIPREIAIEYGLPLSSSQIERFTGVSPKYLNYVGSQIIELKDIKS